MESDVMYAQPAEQIQSCPGVHYVAAAPLMEVMFEQLEYLSAHLTNGEDCPSECSLCARLNEVSNCLLAPFRNPFYEV